MTAPQRTMDTRSKLLEAARAVFAELGYSGAGVREIARRAGAQVSAVNYHFGSKEELYRQVLTELYNRGSTSPMPQLADDPSNPEQCLRRFVHWHVERVLGERSGDFVRLFMQEMRDPSPVLATFIDLSMRPIFNGLTEIVAAIIGMEPHAIESRQAAAGIMGQYVLYKNNEVMVPQFLPELSFGDDEVRQLAARIATFSIGGLRALRDATS
jgi:TetR/AcrR family transcriptional regulator, regulator of cefoperazone and chloramphenicol sensitivity